MTGTRRETLQKFALGGAVVFAGTVPGLRAAAAPLPIRKEINTYSLSDPMVQTLRDGVRLLKARPAGTGPNWTDLANIHGTAAGFNKCPHGNWYFLPWHRAYLLMYEQQIRVVTKNPSFAMPYWDWSAHRTVPQAFKDATYNGQPNPLYVAARNNTWSIPDMYVGPSVMSSIYSQTSFELFASSRPTGQNNLNQSWIKAHGTQGTLEATPHNNIHNNLGGYMPNGNSPMDPIFMMHHGNIDHIWWTWNCKGRQNTTDALWLNMPFTNNYYAPNGSWTTYAPSGLQNIATLGYSYGLCLSKLVFPPYRLLANARLAEIFKAGNLKATLPKGALALSLTSRVNGATLESEVKPPPAALRSTFSNLSALKVAPEVKAQPQTSQVVALIHDLTPPNDQVEVLVFAGVGDISSANDPKDPRYVTTIGFFGANAHGAMGVSASVDLTDHLRGQTGAASADRVHVRLVARPSGGKPDAQVQSTVAHAEVEVVIV